MATHTRHPAESQARRPAQPARNGHPHHQEQHAMTETCTNCGHHWGVTTTPRTNVLCAPCGRPAPNRRPGTYWYLRAATGHPDERYRSADWWDQQTSLADLKHAARLAAGMEAS